MDDPSRILAQARQQLEALKQAGLSRDDLIALLEGEPQQQHQQMPPVTPVTLDASALQNFNHHDINAAFKPPPQYRSSVSTASSSSSRDSCFSTTSVCSSVSATSNPLGESKFSCTSCNKTFKRKFDWKRHEEEFHDRSRKYSCDSCNQSFWSPNTFNQHHKFAHGCQTCPHAEMVMRLVRKRRAYGCGFCAALHGQFEQHIDHVATHFESGKTKQDWSHSNVIYGLLHQHGIIEFWKALIASKYNRFNNCQPIFGWLPELTGRAHGYIENENPGQLQDLLEFFDGSKESAKRIVQLAETCVHVILRPKSPHSSPAAGTESLPISTAASNGSHRQSVRATVREPQRSASTSAMLKANKSVRRIASSTNPFETPPPPKGTLASVPPMTLPSSTQPHQQLGSTNNVYPGYMHTPDATAHPRPQLTPIPRLMGESFKRRVQALDGYVNGLEGSSNVSNPSMTSQALVRDVHISDNFYPTPQEWSQLFSKQSRQPSEDSRNPPPLTNIAAKDLTSSTADFEAAAEGSGFRSDSLSIEPSSARSSVQADSTEPSALSVETAMDRGYIPQNQAAFTFANTPSRWAEILIHEDDDIQSISSVPDDVASPTKSSSTIPDYRQAAVNYLVKKFTDDSELLALYREATKRMGESMFLRNHRGLLKRYFLDLQSEEHTPSQKLAVRFLRLRSERIRISSRIRRTVMPSNSTILENTSITLQQENDKLSLLGRWLGQQDSTEIVEDGVDTASDNSDDSDGDSDTRNSAVVAQMNYEWTLSKLEATAEFLITGRPFSLYKENLRRFLYPGSEACYLQGNLPKNVAQTRTSMLEQSSRGIQRAAPGPVVHAPTTSNADEKQSTEQSARRKTPWKATYLSRCLSWLRSISRPKLKVGHRRIEWKCDCGADLYADFPNNDGEQLDNLAFSLQNPGQTNTNQASNIPLGPLNTCTPNSLGNTPTGSANGIENHMGNLMKRYPVATTSSSISSRIGMERPRFLALCVNTGGIYKTLAEIDASSMTSDAAAFSIIKDEYFKTRGLRSRFKLLIKATTIEFIQFTLWNRRGAYISVCNRPNCIPPDDSDDYEYFPKPLRPLLPMPAEIFIHYLEHGEGDLNPIRNDWLPRLPKRLDKRVIDCNEPCFGWGMHIIEGPNREVIFWIAILTILASALTSVLWSTLQNDVQGGAGLGALIVALPPAILTAFLFRLEGI